MRILQVITSLEMGGAETLLVNMIPRLQALGHEVDLCVFNGNETPLMQRLKEQCPQTNLFVLGTGYYNPLYIFKLMRMMRDYDLVHTHNSSPQLFVALASLWHKPLLCTTEHNTSNRKRNWRWYRPISILFVLAILLLRSYVSIWGKAGIVLRLHFINAFQRLTMVLMLRRFMRLNRVRNW